MDGRTHEWNVPPVSYKTSALWGRCPKTTLIKYIIIYDHETAEAVAEIVQKKPSKNSNLVRDLAKLF